MAFKIQSSTANSRAPGIVSCSLGAAVALTLLSLTENHHSEDLMLSLGIRVEVIQ